MMCRAGRGVKVTVTLAPSTASGPPPPLGRQKMPETPSPAFRAERPAFHLVLLRQMLDRDLDDVADVIVGEAVKDILPAPT